MRATTSTAPIPYPGNYYPDRVLACIEPRDPRITHQISGCIPRRSCEPARIKWLLAIVVVLGLLTALLLNQTLQAEPGLVGDNIDAPHDLAQLVVPKPDLSRLEPAIRQRLTHERSRLEELITRADLARGEIAEAFGEMGRLYHAHSLSEPTLACYQRARMLAPQDFRWVYLLGVLYQQTNRLLPAVPVFERALEIRPHDAPAMLRMAQVLLELNETDLADSLFQESLTKHGMAAAAAAGLGQAALSERRFEDAVRWFREALQQQPGATRLYYSLGIAYRSLGELDKARDYLQRPADTDPKFPDPILEETRKLASSARIHRHRALVAVRSNQLGIAAQEFRAAIAIEPDNPALRVGLARVLYLMGDTNATRVHLLEAIARDPDHAPANFHLGMLATEFGDDDKGTLYFEKTLQTDPEHMGAHLQLAHVLMRAGSYSQAAHHYHEVTVHTPQNRLAWLLEGLALLRSGVTHQKARDRLEEGLVVHPEDPMLAYALARLLASSPADDVRDGRRALALASKLYTQSPGLENAETLAMVYAELGDFERASVLQEEAIAGAFSMGRFDLLSRLEEHLRLYRSREPCRTPWAENDPIFWSYQIPAGTPY